ncbi:HTH-type transcriptional repressor PurR [Alishewanella longhuensis]
MILEGNNTFETGIECAQQLLQRPERPTAIFANNDQMAAAVLKVAYSLGIKVPDQLSVAGFDDNMLASRVTPSLTTIRRPVRQMALLATTKMIMSIEQNHKAAANVAAKVAPTLVVREFYRPLSACNASGIIKLALKKLPAVAIFLVKRLPPVANWLL